MAKKKDSKFRTVKCSGCGIYEKVVDDRVVEWFCPNCFMGNGNFFRSKSGKELIKPQPKLKKGSVVHSVFGQKYKLDGVGYVFDKTVYYIAYPMGDKKDNLFVFLGDYQIVK